MLGGALGLSLVPKGLYRILSIFGCSRGGLGQGVVFAKKAGASDDCSLSESMDCD